MSERPGGEEIRRPVRRPPGSTPPEVAPAPAPGYGSAPLPGYGPVPPAHGSGPPGYGPVPPATSAPVPPPREGWSANAMALAGTSLIAALAVLMVVLGGWGSSAGGGAQVGSTSTIEPANTSAGGGPGCVATTQDLLCHEKEQANSSQVSSHDPVITVTGPGAVTLGDPTLMVDGRSTSWTSGGDATGAQIVLQFNEPVTVGTIGLQSGGMPDSSGSSSAGRRVLAATWSFSPATVTAGGFCGGIPGEFGSPVRQDLSSRTERTITPGIRTCAVRIELDRLSRVAGAGSGAVSISEVVLRAP